ncbi:MAG: 1-deoxy-D-xylulose-5-phosphate reductoisomerase [Bacteroidetes bacterium]|nr:MAG: 1-deoxy-D-xylulose-5-phosphate reductoisomerase [Bacteroidota bacterium]
MKNIAILGSTGSIGTQALEVIENNPEHFNAEILTAGNNAELLIKQAIKFQPDTVVIANEDKYKEVSDALSAYPIKVFAGNKSVEQVTESSSIDLVLTAMVGFSGLLPTINAIKAKKDIALANKETLVVAGELISKLLKENQVNIFPVDSEHSAIFQSLTGEFQNEIEKIYLTASGGPFRKYSLEELKKVTKTQALKHPNWDMGAKITIDSATMMNKGFEAIEAKWLFDLKPEQIDIIVHPQSIIHSLVQFTDGSVKAQMGLPDMKLPIQYAFTYPHRIKTDFPRFNFSDYPELSFEKPDTEKFKTIEIAYEAMNRGGNIPCAVNAANEIVVDAFLKDQIKFTKIFEIIEKTVNKINFANRSDVDTYLNTDKEARIIAKELIK